MTHTLVASEKRQVIIGFDKPFTIIGERINPTGRKKLAAEMIAGNFETIKADALAQRRAGAHILDVNAGVTAVNPNESEPPLLRQTLEIVQATVDIPLCIDSSVTAALKVGLETVKGRPLVNSVTGEEERLEAILPLVAKYNVPVVAISNDETGIARTRTSASPWQRRSSSARPITASSRTTSSSIRWSCRSAPWAPPASRCSGWCGACARSSRSTPPAAPPTSPSECPIDGPSPAISSPWPPRTA